MAKALNELRRILLEMLLYADRHRRTILKECQNETAVEGAGIPLPASPEQHVEDIVQGEHKLPLTLAQAVRKDSEVIDM